MENTISNDLPTRAPGLNNSHCVTMNDDTTMGKQSLTQFQTPQTVSNEFVVDRIIRHITQNSSTKKWCVGSDILSGGYHWSPAPPTEPLRCALWAKAEKPKLLSKNPETSFWQARLNRLTSDNSHWSQKREGTTKWYRQTVSTLLSSTPQTFDSEKTARRVG